MSTTAVLRDLSEVVINESASIYDALSRINNCHHLFQLVVDADGKLVGTVSDGDIRRALLAGHDLNASVTKCMHENPVSAFDVENANKALLAVHSLAPYVPVIDDAGTLVAVVIQGGGVVSPYFGLVFAGGFGRRLGSRARNVPKPMVPVAGRPMIDYVLRQLEGYGIRQIFIAVHYMADQIEEYIRSRDNIAQMTMLRESEPLGTAGALKMLPPECCGDLVMMNADVVSKIDLAAMYSRHQLRDNVMSVAATLYRHEIPYGVVRHDDDGNILGIDEKPVQSWFVSAGIYILSLDKNPTLPEQRSFSMLDVIDSVSAGGGRVGTFPIHEYWADLGTPEELDRASAKLITSNEFWD